MELAYGIHRIEGVRGANAYLYLCQSGKVVVIDTGMVGNAQKIARYVEALGLKREEIELIVLTHPDIDHSGSAAELKRITGARIAVHEADAPSLAGERELKKVNGLLGLVFGIVMKFVKFDAVRPDLTLKEGDAVAELRVLHCPGHTDGSICLYKSGEAVFVGDVLRTDGKGDPKAPSRAMSSNMQQARESVRRIAQLEFEMLLPGHGEPTHPNASNKVRSWLSRQL